LRLSRSYDRSAAQFNSGNRSRVASRTTDMKLNRLLPILILALTLLALLSACGGKGGGY
jgi:hypothetical protein